jgi:uncharacterized HAD superfamily protein
VTATSYQFLNFRGLPELERALQDIAVRLPADVDLVVGVPRSGLLAASILALQLNLPLTDVDGLLAGRTLMTGRRAVRTGRRDGVAGPGRPVIVDDSVLGGGQLREVRERLASAGHDGDALFAAPFVSRDAQDQVDLFAEIVEPPRIFAWNLLHHPLLMARACIDIDGVLCPDPLRWQNDDGDRYREFLTGTPPLFLPSVPVRYVVTARLERYRAETEAWLAEMGVAYDELVMMDLEDADTRRRLGGHARHKAEFYKRSGMDLFVESSYAQAVEIAARSGRQVFAVDRREMVYPSPARALAEAPGPFLRSVSPVPPARVLRSRVRARVRTALGPRGAAAAKRLLRR